MDEDRDDDGDHEPPEFETAERVRYDLDRLYEKGPPLRERAREVLARALARVPRVDMMTVLVHSHFVMADPSRAEYLSPAFLGEGRAMILLGEGILDLPEEEQVNLILPLAARAFLRSPCPLERPAAYPDVGALLYDDEGEELTGAALASGLRECERQRKVYQDAKVDQQIDVHFGEREADELVRSWREQWEAFRRPQTPPG